MTTSTEPRGAGEGQDGQRDGQGPGQPPGTPRAGHKAGTRARSTRLSLEWGWIWGAPIRAPLPPPLPRCLYLFCDSFCTWGFRRGVFLGPGGTAPLPLSAPPKPAVPPTLLPAYPRGVGGTLGRSRPGSGGCEPPILGLWGEPPTLGLPPLPAPGWLSLVGLAQEGGSHWRGCFPLRGQVRTLSPPKSVQLCLHSAGGGLGGPAVPTQGGHRGLHAASFMFGGGSGGGGSCCDHACAKLFGEGGPQPARDLHGGAGNGAKPGGQHSLASAQSPPLLVSPGQLCVPSAAALGGSVGTPTALVGVCTPTGSASVWGGRDQRPTCGPGGTGPSGWIQVTPCPVIPPLPAAVPHGRGCAGAGLAPSPPLCPPWLSEPPVWPCVPRGCCVCPPTPEPWLVLSLGLTNYGALDSLLFSNCC